MSNLRFRVRHVHRTLADHLEAQLILLGWGNSAAPAGDPVNAAVNFGTTPVTFIEFQPDEAGKEVKANTVAITLGDEPSAEDEELGDGLRVIKFPLFVDIYGADQSIAASIASDVKRLLEDLYLPVRDYTTVPGGAVSSEYLELDKDDVVIEKPQATLGLADFKRYWRVVKTMAQVHYVQD